MPSLPQLAQVDFRRRTVHMDQCVTQGRESKRAADIVGDQFKPIVRRQVRERTRDHARETSRTQPFGGRIDRREPLVHDHGLVGFDALVLRVHHFQPLRALAHFAEAEQPRALGQLVVLRLTEVEKAQQQHAAGIVPYDDLQLGTEAEASLDVFDDALHLRAIPGTQVADRHDRRAVFIAQRQMKPEVLHLTQAKSGQRIRERGPDAAECGQRRASRVRRGYGGRRCCASGHGNRALPYGRTRIASTSTWAPFGKPDTSMVERAGYGCWKYSAITALTAAKLPRSVT